MQVKCACCGASVELDLDDIQTVCPFCRNRLTINVENLSEIVASKEKTKRFIAREEHITKRSQMQYDHEKREGRSTAIIVGLLVVVFLGLPLSGVYFGYISHNNKVSELKALEQTIEEDIRAGDYDSAYINANRLYLDDNWSPDEKKVWDEKRKAYLELIAERKQQAELNNPDNIVVGIKSGKLLGKDSNEVKELFEELGFTNIQLKESVESANFFHKEKTVEHILIDGKTNFSASDYFDKAASIVIYYYK